MSNGRYVLEEKEAKIVKIVFEMAASGKLPNEILKIVLNMDTDYFTDDSRVRKGHVKDGN